MSVRIADPPYASRRDPDMASSFALHDPAFEPHSAFMFEAQADDDEEFLNMQRSIASLKVLTDRGHMFHRSADSARGDVMDDVVGMSENVSAHFGNPFMVDRRDLSPPSPSWAGVQVGVQSPSVQAEIVNRRSLNVQHQFGQITPPSDATPEDYTEAAVPSLPHPHSQATLSAKSERARNAANQRHAKAKKARRDSVRGMESPDAEHDGVEDKRERYREKNRLAAAKCRAKKKVNTDDLEDSARIITAQNNKLRAEERELRDLFSSLRDQALAHDPTQGCTCQALHSYNMHKAHETARGAMGMHGFVVPSPTQRSIDPASPSTVDLPSKNQSFSGMQPQFLKYPGAQSASMAETMAYMPSITVDEMMQRPSSTVVDVSDPNFAFMQSPTSKSIEGDGEGFPEYTRPSSESQQMSYS